MKRSSAAQKEDVMPLVPISHEHRPPVNCRHHPGSAELVSIIVAILVAILAEIKTVQAATSATIDFESPPLYDESYVTMQFGSIGVTFTSGFPEPSYFPVIRQTRRERTGGARSGFNVVQVPPAEIDFGRPALLGKLRIPQQAVSLWVRNVSAGAREVRLQLRAFDSEDRRVDRNGSDYLSVASTSSGYTRVSATSSGTDIARFLLVTDPSDSYAEGQRLWIDDVTLESPSATPPGETD